MKSFLLHGVFLGLLYMLACRHAPVTRRAPASVKKTPTPTTSRKEGNRSDVATVIKTARSYLGTSYSFGGTTSSGMDCSGLMCTSFKSIDLILPRVSADQSKIGKEIQLSEVQNGDLVFFTDKKGNAKITHVGLVTDVKDEGHIYFIHASTRRGVVEENLKENYYFPLIIKLTRPY